MEQDAKLNHTPPPLRAEHLRVDEKGRIKLGVDFAEFLRSFGHEDLYICRLVGRAFRVYPRSSWNWNLEVLKRDDRNVMEHMLKLAARYGGDSKLDGEGRITLPHSMRSAFNLPGNYVYVTPSEARLDIFTEADYEAEMADAEKVVFSAIERLTNLGFK